MSKVIEKIVDHHARALARLLQQYKDKQLIAAVLSVADEQVQQLEDTAFDVMVGLRLSDAEGAQLDILGKIVGQARENSADDAEYRLRIAARIKANVSNGSPADIYAVFRILLPAHTLELSPRYPAAFVLEITEAVDEDLVELYRKLLADCKAAGVGGQGLYSLYEVAETFQFTSLAGGDDQEDDVDSGFADDAQTAGGYFADVFVA